MAGGKGDEGQGPWAMPGSGSGDQGVGATRPFTPPPPWPVGVAGGPVPVGWEPGPQVRRSRRGLVVLLVGVSVVIAVVAVALVVRVVDDSGSAESAFAEADPAEAATVVVPDDYEDIEIGDVSVSLPASWVWAPLDQGTEGLGERLAPDDPLLSADLDARLGALPRSALLIGFDEGDLDRDPRQFDTNIVVLRLPSTLPDDAEEMRSSIAAEVEAQDASVSSVSYLTSDVGPALRVRYRMSQLGLEVEGLQYWYATSDGPYTVSFTSDDLDAYVDVADAVGSSFQVGSTASDAFDDPQWPDRQDAVTASR